MHGTATMRDSSRDQRTYWLRNGLYYSRAHNLGEPAACELPADKLAQIPEADRKVVVLEAAFDPVFCSRLARVMNTDPDWVHTISNSAKRAIANEMNPAMFPRSRGTWPRLRELATTLLETVHAEAAQGRIPVAVKSVSGLRRLGDLGQFDIIASLIGSIGSAAAGIYGANITARAQQQVAQIQANSAMQAAQANMAMSNAATAIQAVQRVAAPIQSAIEAVTTATVGGVPLLALAIPAVGLIIYLTRKGR